MSHSNSRVVTSSQTGIHTRLTQLVTRYQNTTNLRPISDHTRFAFQNTREWLAGHEDKLVIDAGCGNGESTAMLAQRYPSAKVIGLDRSARRLQKHTPQECKNYLLVQANIADFLRLARGKDWRLAALYLLYPNPYPKPCHVQRRWHASPTMVDVMSISARVEVRSNWKLYCEEFAHASAQYGWHSQLSPVTDVRPTTAFEKKYRESEQTCWCLRAQPNPAQLDVD